MFFPKKCSEKVSYVFLKKLSNFQETELFYNWERYIQSNGIFRTMSKHLQWYVFAKVATQHTFKPKLEKKPALKKFFIFSQTKFSLYFRKMNSPVFQEKKLSYISGNGNPKKLLIFQEVIFRARKMKDPIRKNFLYFWKWDFIALKNLIKLPQEKLDARVTFIHSVF